ncbi:MAG TPA: CaiB/BaiF CoA-transferase family protein, partial [Acidimicrobiales bacterium]|nr:CaiB/BaiF CoA-transferase family protein [Acidimicrobiales bacterium]
LAGLRVVDFGHGGVGVECGRMLAEYGADVVKVESRTYPDFIRLVLGSEMTPAFASSSRSKRGFGADLKHPDGIAVVRELVKRADVVIENNSTGTMANLGLAYDDLHALNPGLVMVSSQLMGSRGPFADWNGYGPTLQSVGGLSWLWKFDDGDPPPGSPAIHPDHLAGRVCALFAAAALFARNRSRRGAHIEIAQVEALMATLGDLFLAEGLAPGSVRPMGNDSLRGAPWGVFPCVGDERWCVICVRDDADWASLREAMDDPAWAVDDRFDSADGRLAHRREVNAGVAGWTTGRSQEDAVAACELHGVPAAPVASTVDQFADTHLVERGFFPEVDQPPLGPLTLDGPCFRGTVMTTPFLGPAPGLGEHTRDICIDELGMDPDEVEQLIESGALEVDTSAEGGEPDPDG